MSTEYIEVPTGVINGVNTVFTVAHTIVDSVVIYLNGMVIPGEDTVYGFTITPPSTITLITAPTTGDFLLCYYIGV